MEDERCGFRLARARLPRSGGAGPRARAEGRGREEEEPLEKVPAQLRFRLGVWDSSVFVRFRQM